PLIDARGALKTIDRASLTGRGATELDTVVWYADQCAEAERFQFVGVDSYDYPVPYVISQLTGAYQKVPDALDTKHIIETKADCEAYLARLTDFATALRAESVRARAQADMGMAPP